MKNGLVSKLNQLAHPSFLISAFVVGLAAGIFSPSLILAGVFITVALALVLLLARVKSAALLIFLALGVTVGEYQAYLSKTKIPDGCIDVKVESRAKKLGNNFVYKIKSDHAYLLLDQHSEYRIGDGLNVCSLRSYEIKESDRHFLLSQYKIADVLQAQETKKLYDGRGIRNSLQKLSENLLVIASNIYRGDQATLAYGVLFGGGDFSREFKTDLKRSGTTHIVAVSGYNVSIITNWLFEGLRNIGKNFSGIVSVIVLLGFYLVTGGSASVLRAAIMGVIILLTKFIGRKVAPYHLLVLAAAIILAFNPFAIYDWGFQLSFLATAGIFFLSPVLDLSLGRLKFNQTLTKIFSETLGAQIFVLPILVGNFGSFSVISPLANLLILPVIPLAMGLVFVSFLGYVIFQPLGLFAGGLTKLVLAYVIWVIRLSAQIPFASLNLKVSPVAADLVGFSIIIAATYILRRKYLSQSQQVS